MNHVLSQGSLRHLSERLKNKIYEDVVLPFILINNILSENDFPICPLKAGFKV